MQTLEQLREQDRRTAADPGVVGLGGWLVLPLLGLIGNGVVKVAAPVALLVLFFRRKRLFAVYYITWLVAGIALMLLDLLFVYHAFRAYYDSPGVVFWDEQTKRDLGQTIFGAAIWIPYMLNSKRVQNTFVN